MSIFPNLILAVDENAIEYIKLKATVEQRTTF